MPAAMHAILHTSSTYHIKFCGVRPRTNLQLGGIGFVHYNMPLEQQVEAVKRVKQQAAGFEANPIVMSPKQELKEIKDIQARVL